MQNTKAVVNNIKNTQEKFSPMVEYLKPLKRMASIAIASAVITMSAVTDYGIYHLPKPLRPIDVHDVKVHNIKNKGRILTINGEKFQQYLGNATIFTGKKITPFKAIYVPLSLSSTYSSGIFVPTYNGMGYYKFPVFVVARDGETVRTSLESETPLSMKKYYKDLSAVYGIPFTYKPPKVSLKNMISNNGLLLVPFSSSNGRSMLPGDGSLAYPYIVSSAISKHKYKGSGHYLFLPGSLSYTQITQPHTTVVIHSYMWETYKSIKNKKEFEKDFEIIYSKTTTGKKVTMPTNNVIPVTCINKVLFFTISPLKFSRIEDTGTKSNPFYSAKFKKNGYYVIDSLLDKGIYGMSVETPVPVKSQKELDKYVSIVSRYSLAQTKKYLISHGMNPKKFLPQN